MYDLWKQLFAEFLGTFILVFVGSAAVSLSIANGGSIVGNALAFGLTYLILIYTLNSFCSCNFNPAISFALAVDGRLGWCRMLLLWVVQILGAIAAAALVAWIYGVDFSAPGGELVVENPWNFLVLEMMLTFFLIFTFLFVTRNPMIAIISGFILGLVLTANILVGGFLGKVGINPAYSLAAGIFSGNLGSYWLFLLGPFLGALLAVFIYKALTIYWSCTEAVEKGCGDCGQLPFYEEWKFCDPQFLERGFNNFNENREKLEMMGADPACFNPCNMPPVKCAEPVCDPCEIKKRGYRYRQL